MDTIRWPCIAYLLLLSWGVGSASRLITGKDQGVVDKPESLIGLGGQIRGGLGGPIGGGLVGGIFGGGVGGGINFSPGFGLGGIIGGGESGGNCGGGCGGIRFGSGERGGSGFVTPGYGTPGFGFGGTTGGQIGCGLYYTPPHHPAAAATSKAVRLYFGHGDKSIDATNVHNHDLKVDHAPVEGRNSHGQNGTHVIEDKHEQRKMPTDESNTNAEGHQGHIMEAMAPESV